MTTTKSITLPADPDGDNDNRAAWAMKAVVAFMKATGLKKVDGLDTAISDLISDLGHLCDREGLEMSNMVRRAASHYDPETDPSGLREDDCEEDEEDMGLRPFGAQFDFYSGPRLGDGTGNPGKCVTCGTQCDQDGICPQCAREERRQRLGELLRMDVYTDAHEYRDRVLEIRELVEELL